MQIIFVLIGISILMALIFLVWFIWAVRSGQYEDDYTPSIRILFDDITTNTEKEENNGNI